MKASPKNQFPNAMELAQQVKLPEEVPSRPFLNLLSTLVGEKIFGVVADALRPPLHQAPERRKNFVRAAPAMPVRLSQTPER